MIVAQYVPHQLRVLDSTRSCRSPCRMPRVVEHCGLGEMACGVGWSESIENGCRVDDRRHQEREILQVSRVERLSRSISFMSTKRRDLEAKRPRQVRNRRPDLSS